MTQPQLKDLLEAGVHFGHQTRRWNPKMRRFIFAERSGIYLIDLQKTLRQLQAAQDLVREVVTLIASTLRSPFQRVLWKQSWPTSTRDNVATHIGGVVFPRTSL